MPTSTFKTSTIFVASGRQRTKVFRSMEEVPSPLRKRLHENLSGPNTRTLIVADRRGREYLLHVLQRATRSSALQAGEASARVQDRATAAWTAAKRYWLEVALIGLLATAGWTLFSGR